MSTGPAKAACRELTTLWRVEEPRLRTRPVETNMTILPAFSSMVFLQKLEHPAHQRWCSSPAATTLRRVGKMFGPGPYKSALSWLPLLVVLALCLSSAVSARASPIPPPPTSHVTDEVGLLDLEARASLAARLAQFERSTGHQVLVWIGDPDHTTSIEAFAVEAFSMWKIGRASEDDGLALFVFARQRKARIEVGYGLEARVTDLISAKIIRDVLVPGLVKGNPGQALRQTVDALMAVIRDDAAEVPSGTEKNPAVQAAKPNELSTTELVVAIVLAIAFALLLVTNPRLALSLLWVIMAMGRGSGSGRGGGFSGGGGRSGGGGASGGW